MAKAKRRFVCTACGHAAAQWVGKCPACKAWNSLEEEVVAADLPAVHARRTAGTSATLMPLREVDALKVRRLPSGDDEFDRVLGGGMVPGGVVLLGGEPGIGKSTLMLQVAMAVGATGGRVVYVAGEESPEQVKLRAERLGEVAAEVLILPETDAAAVLDQLRIAEPALVLVDSVQTLFLADVESAPGSVSQIRETSAALTRWAKQTATPLVFIGHITKEGSIAGPKVLEHLVDVVLTFEGERNHAYRMLRAAKNRFGTTSELGLYEMQGTGLVAVDTPSDVLLSDGGRDAASGTAVAVAVEGARPFLVEVQALVSSAVYGTPQRSCTGFDVRRLNMLLAVLEKRCGFKLATRDVFLNIAGGLRIADPALDLAVVAAVLSSSLDVPLPPGLAFAGEVGLSGEIRPVARWAQRWGEASRMGLERLIVSGHTRDAADVAGIERVMRVAELHRHLF